MAKGPIITDEVKRMISEVYMAHSNWPAKTIQHEVDNRLRGRGPGLSAVQKILTMIHEREREQPHQASDIDAPFSLGSLGMKEEYEFPPEVIPIILDVKKNWPKPNPAAEAEFKQTIEKLFAEKYGTPFPWHKLPFTFEPRIFTVRVAKWVARIAFVLKDRLSPEGIGWWAHFYAKYEKECELAGIPCNTSHLDTSLLTGDLWPHIGWALSKEGKQDAQIEERRMFGHTLDDIDLTPLGWKLYWVWLGLVETFAKKWPNLSIKEREDFVKRLRAWVIEKETVEELICPEELLAEVEYHILFSKDS